MGDNTFEQILAEIEAEPDANKVKEKMAALSDEDKIKATNHLLDKGLKAKAEADVELGKVIALKQERQRVETQNQNQNLTFEQKMRKENGDKAIQTICNQLGISKPEEVAKIREEFDKRNPQAVMVDNLMLDAKAAAAAAFPDKFFGAYERVRDLEAGAADFNAQGARNVGGPSEGRDPDGFSKDAHEVVRQSATHGVTITLEQAQAYIDDGGLNAPKGHIPSFTFDKALRRKK